MAKLIFFILFNWIGFSLCFHFGPTFSGGYFQNDVVSCGTGNYNNPFTGGLSCPSGTTATQISRVLTAENPRCGSAIVACYNPNDNAGTIFGGFYQTDDCGVDNVANPLTGGLSCPSGFSVARIGRGIGPASTCGVNLYACWGGTGATPVRLFGGAYSSGSCGGNTNNFLTGGLSCPNGYTAALVGKMLKPEFQSPSCANQIYMCYANPGPCNPPTCVSGTSCGVLSNHCGNTDCGTCSAPGQICSNNICTCPTLTCNQAGVVDCGTKGNLCSSINCGSCTNTFQICSNGQCVCPPITCLSGDCGVKSNGCSTRDCGNCANNQVCQGNLCGCPNITCTSDLCGQISNGCGQTVNCGSCSGGKTCSSNNCVCPPLSCGLNECGVKGNPCSSINCGNCTNSAQVCVAGVCNCPAIECLPTDCGVKSNGCTTKDCGNCSNPFHVCTLSGTCQCPTLTCQPGECGTKGNGCSSISCGTCGEDELCVSNRCTCGPVVCNANDTCVTISNACNNTRFCGEGCPDQPLIVEPKLGNSWIFGVAFGVLGCILCVLIVIILVLALQKRRNKKMVHQLETFELNPASVENSTVYARIPARVMEEFQSEFRSTSSDGHSWNINVTELTLENEIGRGAYGVVFKGKWRKLDVAVKKILGSDINEEQMRDFLAEIKLMKNIRPHKHVVQLIGMVAQPLCIVTLYYPNGSLWTYLISDSKLTLEMALKIMHGISLGMLHLHQENVIHRDLAARNVLLNENFEAVVSDFGLARITVDSSAKSGVTKSMVGPIKWMAPESIMKQIYSVYSDTWSFGITCYEILSRQEPWPDFSPIDAAFAVRDGKRLELPSGTPEPLVALIQSCWETVPENRPNFESLSSSIEALSQTMRK